MQEAAAFTFLNSIAPTYTDRIDSGNKESVCDDLQNAVGMDFTYPTGYQQHLI